MLSGDRDPSSSDSARSYCLDPVLPCPAFGVKEVSQRLVVGPFCFLEVDGTSE
jgi:hypothetical protein